jgi:serine/threonine protein kinase
MELCSGGTLQDWLENTPYRYPRPPFMAQIRLGVDYIHKQGLIHRDLKPSNIFLSKNEQGVLSIKIGGFGRARQRCKPDDATQMDVMSLDVGTPTYQAPEMLDKKGIYDHTVDTYSMGLICLAICSKWNNHAELNELFTNARKGSFPPELKTSDSGRLVARMLCKDPETRKQACLLNEHDPRAENVPDIGVLSRSSPDPEVESNCNLNPDPDMESVMEPFYDPEQDLDCDGADIEDTGMIFHKGTTILTFFGKTEPPRPEMDVKWDSKTYL